MTFSIVVFPAPLGPIIAMISPGLIYRLRLSKAFRPPNEMLMFSARSMGSGFSFMAFFLR